MRQEFSMKQMIQNPPTELLFAECRVALQFSIEIWLQSNSKSY